MTSASKSSGEWKKGRMEDCSDRGLRGLYRIPLFVGARFPRPLGWVTQPLRRMESWLDRGLSALINSGHMSGGKDENLYEGFYCRVS